MSKALPFLTEFRIFTLNFILLKQFITISLSVFCLMLGSLALASTSEDKEKAKDPGKATVKAEVGAEAEEAPASENASIVDGGMYLNQTQDTTNLNSVCKFNFIFYFIYKMKYDEEPSGNEYLNYEF